MLSVQRMMLVPGMWVVCLAGCAVEPPTPYPAAWPAIGKVSGCEALSGTYKNEALATTMWQSEKMPETSRAYLAYLLTDGTPGSFSTEQSAIAAVTLDGKNLAYGVVPDTAVDRASISTQGKWSCTSTGEISVQFEGRTFGEHSEGYGKFFLTLSKAQDGALIVRQEIRLRSVSFGFIPDGHDDLDWMMFAVLPAP